MQVDYLYKLLSEIYGSLTCITLELLSITVLNEKYSFPFRELAFPIGLSELLTSIMFRGHTKSKNLDISLFIKMACVGSMSKMVEE